jgi:ribosomal protein L37AE/L43A
MEIAQCSGCGRQRLRLRINRTEGSIWYTCKHCDAEFRDYLKRIETQQEIERLQAKLEELNGG